MNPHEEWRFKADRDCKGAKGMLDEDSTKEALQYAEIVLNFIVNKCL